MSIIFQGTMKEEKTTARANESGYFKTRERTGELSIRDVVSVFRIEPPAKSQKWPILRH